LTSLRVTFLVPYPPGRSPGQRFRFEQWLRLLPQGAVDADIRPLFGRAAFARLYEPGGTARKAAQSAQALGRRLVQAHVARRADVVVVYRGAFPLGPPVFEALLERRVPVVYDFDDAIWLGGTSEANASAARLKRPEGVGRIVAGAAATTVGNQFLASYAGKFSDRVHVIPTTLDVEEYRPQPRAVHDLVRVGWSGSPTTSVHLRSIEGALRRMLDELPVELVVTGDPRFELPGAPRVTVKAWLAETEIAEVGAFDIGLMPLPDDDWSRGKCGFKALLSMALGVPPVVSPVGVNTEIVEHGINGLVASDEDAWVAAIARLVDDPALRAGMGIAARETVVQRYSGQQWAPRFLEVLEEARQRGPIT
jgi:glycosyltransferase involved in cell wall biosynthesis